MSKKEKRTARRFYGKEKREYLSGAHTERENGEVRALGPYTRPQEPLRRLTAAAPGSSPRRFVPTPCVPRRRGDVWWRGVERGVVHDRLEGLASGKQGARSRGERRQAR